MPGLLRSESPATVLWDELSRRFPDTVDYVGRFAADDLSPKGSGGYCLMLFEDPDGGPEHIYNLGDRDSSFVPRLRQEVQQLANYPGLRYSIEHPDDRNDAPATVIRLEGKMMLGVIGCECNRQMALSILLKLLVDTRQLEWIEAEDLARQDDNGLYEHL